MGQGEKLDKICELEGINLKEFSDLASMNYDSMRAYRKNRYTLSVKAINKICETPRFAKYRNLLLDVETEVSHQAEAEALLDRLRELDQLDDAVDYMKYLIAREEKK